MSNVKCLFIAVMRLATLASSQACHSNWGKQIFQMNLTGLKIPTGGRQTSWLFTNMTEELNWGPPRNNSSLVVRAGLEPATSGFQVRRPNHSATLPPWFTVYFFDIGHPCYDQLTPVKIRYLLTSIMWPYRGLKSTTHRGHVSFKVDRWPNDSFWLDRGLMSG